MDDSCKETEATGIEKPDQLPALHYGAAKNVPYMIEKIKLARRNALLVRDPLTRDMFLTVTGPAESLGGVVAQALVKYWDDTADIIEAELASMGVFTSRHEADARARHQAASNFDEGYRVAGIIEAASRDKLLCTIADLERQIAGLRTSADLAATRRRRRAARKAAGGKVIGKTSGKTSGKATVTGKAGKNSRAKRR